ncbi:ABC transporter substrate-binding protein [Mesorhizobium sp. SB112]|uniref:ABC transporter substrate-binding protein n=1 Tax=Mesorhizobium sp. SB112 TaxID=3151853 RepID=UPI0032670CD6
MKRIIAILIVSVLNSWAAFAAEAPRRVVSMNVCTDQLAMLIAGEGQLYSVSYLAGDKTSSVLADQAGRYVVNHGLAEEIFLMQPDLVIAGTFTTRTTVSLLRRLGFHVEEFAPSNSFEDIRQDILRMGALLDRQAKAAELLAELDTGLAELAKQEPTGKTVALYYPNSYTSGSGTMVDAIVKASGLTNLADTLGMTGTVKLPLESLIMARPDLIVGGSGDYEGPALADQGFQHPAFQALATDRTRVSVPSKYTICGAPFTLEAVRMMSKAAK